MTPVKIFVEYPSYRKIITRERKMSVARITYDGWHDKANIFTITILTYTISTNLSFMN